MEYTPDGNIIRKGDAGDMVYTNPNRPYAATGNTPEKEACIHSGLQVGYTAADRPAWIEEGNRKAEFTYNSQFDRVRMRMTEEGKTVYTKYYLGGNYEAHCDSSGTEERLYVGGDCYEAPALLVRKEGKTEIRFLHRDYLGSILQVADNKRKHHRGKQLRCMGKQKRSRYTGNLYRYRSAKPDDRKRVYRT